MSSVELSPDEPFVYSIFGLQSIDGETTTEKSALKDTFNALITPKANHVDCIIQEDSVTPHHGRTFVWLGYWKSKSQYLNWWKSDAVSQFWSALPSDAGMWREILMPDASRTQHTTRTPATIGLGCLGSPSTVGDKIGYWGCYRHRISASVSDQFTSPLKTDIRSSITAAPSTTASIHPGRVLLTHFPDNICFVVEGEDHSAMLDEERSYWFQNFDNLAEDWIMHLMDAGPDSGILDGRLCFDPESGVFRNSQTKALNYNKKIQLFYFQDLRHMERIGRSHKGHVKLREGFMAAYGPGGVMSDIGTIGLLVETTVLKAGEMECEYVGCVEGTGWMTWADQPGFQPPNADSVV